MIFCAVFPLEKFASWRGTWFCKRSVLTLKKMFDEPRCLCFAGTDCLNKERTSLYLKRLRELRRGRTPRGSCDDTYPRRVPATKSVLCRGSRMGLQVSSMARMQTHILSESTAALRAPQRSNLHYGSWTIGETGSVTARIPIEHEPMRIAALLAALAARPQRSPTIGFHEMHLVQPSDL